METITIIIPENPSAAVKFAADEFARLAYEVCGVTAVLTHELIDGSDYIVIFGNDAVNPVFRKFYLDGKINADIKYGSDSYHIMSLTENDHNVLFLCGGSERANIYAVYRYFERFLGCRYFWDGDIVPKANSLLFSDIDLAESPRFRYRGIRYFAHRSLTRFQAEQWNFEDWKREIHWMLKKRMNLFMLRIGLDDMFQKAFPDIVSYPDADSKLPEAGADHDDRTLFWSLQYRGQLRKMILDYAYSLGLEHPEDCGTTTHWYSRTPIEYLEKVKPDLLTQSSSIYSESTGLVWDIRKDKYMEDYFSLTEASVKYYGRGKMFHTIGLAERVYSNDRAQNLRLKKYVIHKTESLVHEKYPNAPLLLAGWDFFYTYKPEEVAALVKDLDPTKTMVFDYTSDNASESNFTNWGVVNNFPWIFGLFGGLQANNEIRGDYDLIRERLKIASSDNSCEGMVFWPEMSHGDPLITEFVAHNSWNPDKPDPTEFASSFCEARYGENSEIMKYVWNSFIPVAALHAWSASKENGKATKNDTDLFFNPTTCKYDENAADKFDFVIGNAKKAKPNAVNALRLLASITMDNEQLRRDIFDIVRTICGRYITALIQLSQKYFALYNGRAGKMLSTATLLLEKLTDILGSHEDYSLYLSLKRLEETNPVNPVFEQTLKNNAAAPYCRSYIYENAVALYLPELRLLTDIISVAEQRGEKPDLNKLKTEASKIRADFDSKPLSEIYAGRPETHNIPYEEIIALIESIEF